MDSVVVHTMAMCNTRYKIEENKLKWNIFWHTNTINFCFCIAYGTLFIHKHTSRRANFTTTAISNTRVFCIFRLRFALEKKRTPRIRMKKRNRKKQNQRSQLTYRKSAIFSLCFMTWLTLIQFIFFPISEKLLTTKHHGFIVLSHYLYNYLLNWFLNYLNFATSTFYWADWMMTMVSLSRCANFKLNWKWISSKIHLFY